MKIKLEAHRGVSNEYPENTLSAFRAAKQLGYSMIELDTKFTADHVCVALHDNSLGRTGRNQNGTKPENDPKISTLTLDEARKFDVGLFMGESFRGERIPTLDEIIDFAKDAKIPLKFDNVLWTHEKVDREKMFAALKESEIDFGITCTKLNEVEEVRKALPTADIHFDGVVAEETLKALSELVPYEKLWIWMRFDNPITSWNKTPPVDEGYAEMVKKYGKLAVWLLTTTEEATRAEALGAVIAETDGRLRPER